MSVTGKLRERITIERQTSTDDEMGGRVTSWNALFSLWAEVVPMSGYQRDQAAQTASPRNYRITVRKSSLSSQIQNTDRIAWSGTVMLIRFIAKDGNQPHYLTMEAEQRAQYAQGVI